MNENVKTAIYVGIALFCTLLGFAATPRQEAVRADAQVGEILFDKFTDPLAAASLEIKKFDEKLGEIEDFKVAKVNDAWVIPSHENYPADAQKQLAEAAGALLDLKIDGIATQIDSEHSVYGVLEPSTAIKVGAEGVGTLVVIQDSKDNDLVRLIIGKQVKGSTDQRFVRRPGQSVVYVTKIAADKLTTDFDKWIEKDLLKLNGWDVAKLTLKDYTVVLQRSGLGVQASYDPRMEAIVSYDEAGSKWTLDKFTQFARGKPIPAELGEQEELNNQALNDMKFAVDDLKIVNVVRKPKGLGASLTADETAIGDRDAQQNLIEMGFVPVKAGSQYEIFAANGEAYVTTKEGVEYVLRFGNIADSTKAADEGKLNRYLFVTARLNDSMLPPPKLEEEPAEPAGTSDEKKPAEEDKTPKEGAKGAQGEAGAEGAAAKDDKKEEAKDEDDKKGQEDDARRAERERIRKANQRKTDEYNDKVKKAKAKVTELNARFADWYYVVSEDTYKKIHLGRNDIVKEGSKAKEEGFGPDAFRELEKQGLGGKK